MAEDDVPNGNGVVKFTVKEMFQDIQKQLTSIDGKLDTKVDSAAFTNLVSRVDQKADKASFDRIAHTVAGMQEDQAKIAAVAQALALEKSNKTTKRQWLIPTLASVVGVLLVGGEVALAILGVH